jgi:hypothetical protein
MRFRKTPFAGIRPTLARPSSREGIQLDQLIFRAQEAKRRLAALRIETDSRDRLSTQGGDVTLRGPGATIRVSL